MMDSKLSHSRRQFLKKAAVSCSGLILPRSLLASEKKLPLKIGYLPITDATPLLVAHSLGYFSREGLAVEKPVMVRSWKVLIESFLAGKFNLTHMLFPIPVWMRFKQNIPVKVLAWNHTNGSALTVKGDSDIHHFSDLGGKQVAVPSWYSMHNLVLQMGLESAGLKPVIRPQLSKPAPDEVNLLILSPPDMPTALLSGKIDGFIVADPFSALSEIKFNARVMRFTGDIWKNHPCCVIVAHENFIDEHEQMIQKAMNAIVRAQLWCRNNMKEAAHLISRNGEGYLPVTHDIIEKAFEPPEKAALTHPHWDVQRIGFQPYPYPTATRFIIEQMAQTLVEGDVAFLNDLDIDLAVKELVDERFVTQAIQRIGGLKHFFPDEPDPKYTREEVVEVN